MYKVYIKMIFTSRIFWIALMINVLTFFAGAYQSFIVQDSVLECFSCGAIYGTGQTVASVLFPLPFFVLYVEEIKKRAVYFQIVRSSKRKYLFHQIAAVFTSVAGISIIVLLVFALICRVYGCEFSLTQNEIETYGFGILETVVRTNLPLFYFLVYLSYLLFMLPGVFFTMLIACFVKNKYIVFAMPWIVFRFFQILALVLGNPYIDWTNASFVGTTLSESMKGMLYCFLYPTVLCLCAIISYVIVFKRRFRNGKM